MSHFKDYSKYYDLLYKDKDYVAETEFIVNKLKSFNHSIETLSEFGCGSGIHALEMASQFKKIQGVDLSQGMVDMANGRIEKADTDCDISFSQGNICTYKFQEKADALISLFHVMSYLTSNEQWDQTLSNAKDNLKEGGLFFFDYWYGPAVLNLRPSYREKVIENEELHVLRKSKPIHKTNENVVEVHFDIQIKNKVSGEENQVDEVHPMRYLFLPELDYILEKNGFEVIESKGFLTDIEPSDATWGVYTLARLKKK